MNNAGIIPTDNYETSQLLAFTSQQAVMPRHLDEGIYAILNADGGTAVVETPGYTQQREHEWAQARSGRPEFVDRDPVLLDVDSFIDYLAENTLSNNERNTVSEPQYAHSYGELELWADIDGRKITAILDGGTGRRRHTATLTLTVSREWTEWLHIDGKLIGQADFAQFIEDHLSTIAFPDAAVLVDICETLTGNTSVAWRRQTLGKNGQRQFSWEETVEAKAGVKGDLAIPTELTLVLRPFQGSDPVGIQARFRFQIRDGHLALGVRLAEPERALEDAFGRVVEAVQDRVPVGVRLGRP